MMATDFSQCPALARIARARRYDATVSCHTPHHTPPHRVQAHAHDWQVPQAMTKALLLVADLAVRFGSGGERGSKETRTRTRLRPRNVADSTLARVPGADGKAENVMSVLYDNVSREPSHHVWDQ